ncbi:MAG: response regulator [Gammaproteobacteria bacterium]|nr:response regulator [Gammaproteobacteria bacterium]
MKRILVVDDHAENRYFLQALMTAKGWQVEEAGNGHEALERMATAVPDAVISDLLMPVMDGYTLLRKVRADARFADLTFIVYTATYTSADDERLARDLGADAFLLKPAEPDDLLTCVEQSLVARSAKSHAVAVEEGGETDVLELYNRSLIRKLEAKMEQLDEANRTLQADIAKRRAVEASLRASEERFRLVGKATRDAIWDWDLGADTLWWNEGLEHLFGYPHGLVKGGHSWWLDRVHDEDRQRVAGSHREAVTTDRENWSAAYRFRRDDGSYADVEDRGYVLRDDEGQALRIVGVLSDVTERKAMEAQLRQAQRLEAIGQLTGGIAHDFNNLLTVIMGNAELLAESSEPGSEAQESATMISASAQRGADLTRRLLAFARKQTLEARVIDVNAQVGELEPLLRQSLGAQVQIAFHLDAVLWPALVDPAQLENALLNLCLNARDAMTGGGWLTVETANVSRDFDGEEAAEPHDYVMLAVSDTGAGIAPEHLARVFEPFFTTKAEGKGSGLGLAMVYGFIKQSGGYINIYSEPGRGTTVKLYLPRAAAEAQDDAPASAVQLPGGQESILVVEDDELVRAYTSQVLAMLGYEVHVASEALEALDILRCGTPVDLLFTDIVMPGMNGFALAEAAVRLRPGIKVLYTSGYTRQAAARQDPETAMAQMLTKPYARQDLARRLREVLDA